jgi:hypothetical protein
MSLTQPDGDCRDAGIWAVASEFRAQASETANNCVSSMINKEA